MARTHILIIEVPGRDVALNVPITEKEADRYQRQLHMDGDRDKAFGPLHVRIVPRWKDMNRTDTTHPLS
jgi:hypothetical protein